MCIVGVIINNLVKAVLLKSDYKHNFFCNELTSEDDNFENIRNIEYGV